MSPALRAGVPSDADGLCALYLRSRAAAMPWLAAGLTLDGGSVAAARTPARG